jgi:serine/threonine-protein phosphatase PP1 catalytic subunit
VDNYKAVDERRLSERLRRVRRKPGLDQLGDGAATPPLRKRGHVRGGDGSTSYLEAIQRLDAEKSLRREHFLEEKRRVWEESLPKPFCDYLAYVSEEMS